MFGGQKRELLNYVTFLIDSKEYTFIPKEHSFVPCIIKIEFPDA